MRTVVRVTARASVMALATALFLVSCVPPEAQRLNAMGDQATAERKYEQAVSYYSQSLAIAPDQDKIRARLEAAKILLRQIYVDKSYEGGDGPRGPVGEYLSAWRMSAALPTLGVDQARVPTIRLDLVHRFEKSEPRLRSETEPHAYYSYLTQMIRLVAESAVQRAQQEGGSILQEQHVRAAQEADRARLPGLALLNVTAAATFAPKDTGLWAEAEQRRQGLLKALAIPVGLSVQSEAPSENDALLGGLRRRLPPIFVVTSGAPLQVKLRARRPDSTQRQVRDQKSARCQVATEREPNKEGDSLKDRAEVAKGAVETQRRAVDTAAARCSNEPQASSCASTVSSAQRDLSSAVRDYEELERKVGSCPPVIEKPVYKIFFYERHTLYREVTAVGHLLISRGGETLTARGVNGAAAAQDTFGDGLSCADIAPDPLQINSIADLQIDAENRLLDSSMGELLAIRRKSAESQLAGGEGKEQRLDGLVRARLVDDSFTVAREQLSRHLTSAWSADFGVTDRIVQ